MTDPTMEALDAAVQEAKHRVLHEWGPDPLKYTDDYLKMSLDLDALIAAAEARGAARERGRECVWRWDSEYGEHLVPCANDQSVYTTPYCKHCGGRVRVEEVGDAMP